LNNDRPSTVCLAALAPPFALPLAHAVARPAPADGGHGSRSSADDAAALMQWRMYSNSELYNDQSRPASVLVPPARPLHAPPLPPMLPNGTASWQATVGDHAAGNGGGERVANVDDIALTQWRLYSNTELFDRSRRASCEPPRLALLNGRAQACTCRTACQLGASSAVALLLQGTCCDRMTSCSSVLVSGLMAGPHCGVA
jgi:hypothetical protein